MGQLLPGPTNSSDTLFSAIHSGIDHVFGPDNYQFSAARKVTTGPCVELDSWLLSALGIVVLTTRFILFESLQTSVDGITHSDSPNIDWLSDP
jgi:hypothetical protein